MTEMSVAAQQDEQPYDAIFVGAGINGLVGAALLAKHGWRVLVLERSDWLGGAIRTIRTEAGFETELMSCWHGQFLGSPGYRELRDDLEKHGLRYVNTDKPMAVVTPDGRSLMLTTDHATNAARFEALKPGEGRAWDGAVGTLFAQAPDLLGIRDRYPWSANAARWAWGVYRRQGRSRSLVLLGSLLVSARNWVAENFSDPLIGALLAPWALHGTGGPDEAGSATVVRAATVFMEAAGQPLPVGGGKALPTALAAIIESHGGRCLTGVDVEQIWVKGKRAKGVVAGRQRWSARRAVICSVTTSQLYSRLLTNQEVPDELREQSKKIRRGLAIMQIAFSLERKLDWAVPDDLSKVGVIHITSDVDAISRAANEGLRGLLPAEPTICVGQPMALDPSRGPEGTSQLWVQLLDVPSIPVGDAAGEIVVTDGWTEDVRNAFADRIQRQLSRHLPGLDTAIIERIVMSPADLEAANINLIGGSVSGGATDLDQMLLLRPSPYAPAPYTPFRQLYHIGASTHPGGSLYAGSGVLIADMLRRRRWPFRLP